MKSLFAVGTAISLFLTGLLGVNTSSNSSVVSIHAFEEPLIAIGDNNSEDQDSDLISALQTFQKRKSYDDVSAITNYLAANPQSRWKFALLANLGIVYRKAGYFSRAIDTWEQAWALGKNEKDVKAQALANQVAADLATLLSSLGRSERLEPLLKELKGRKIYGSAGTLLISTRESLWLMKNKPEVSFKCGPYALDSIRAFKNKKDGSSEPIHQAQSSSKGFSLVQVRDLSNSLNMNYQMAKREPGAQFITPSVIHWKSGHYAALLKKEGDQYLTNDPTFGHPLLVTAGALEDEASGYFLVPSGNLPNGWHKVLDTEGKSIWGRGQVPKGDPTATKPDDKKCDCPKKSSRGMAVYSISAMLVNLSIEDTPEGYSPPVGPDAHFIITYNELEADQPGNFSFFNFGQSWNCSWLSYVKVPTTTGATASINIGGGGQESYSTYTYTSSYPGYVGYYSYDIQSQATLWVTTSGTFERRMPDGSKEVFSFPSSSSSPVYMFLTSIVDPQGNTMTFGYDTTSSYYQSTGNARLSTVTDALGLSTTLTYGLSADPLKVTQITDPYGRTATFAYSTTAPFQLKSITDVIGIVSNFTYGSGSMISQMTTPYGSTVFTFSEADTTGMYSSQFPGVRSLNVTEPDGSEVQAETHLDGSPTGRNYSGEPVPSGAAFSGNPNFRSPYYLNYRNTFYWGKKAMQIVSNNPDANDPNCLDAYIFHFLHTANGFTEESGVLESEKPALENRIWYDYPGEPSNNGINEGTSANPTFVARVLANGTTQTIQYQYNNPVNPAAITKVIDAVGRQTNYTYDTATGIDLTSVTQTTAAGTDTIKSITYNNTINPPHLPAAITDAAGQTTSYTYNSKGQITSVKPPVQSGQGPETTTCSYTNNFLTSITQPMTGAVTNITPDTLNGHTINRVKSVSDPETYTLTYSYDNLDRITQILYPDSTTTTFSYLNLSTGQVDLDLHAATDRLGRTTKNTYDATRHLISTTDPLSRTTHYGWCSCGSLVSITDAASNITYFNRDLESRLTSKVYPGQTQPPTNPDYIYDATGRVATVTDKRGDVATYSYNTDDSVSGVSYSLASGTAAPPTMSYSYDTYYPRLTAVGGISIGYVPAGSLGGGKPRSVTNTLTGGTAAITYAYDEWGRVVGRNIDGANSQTTVFDSLGRVTNNLNLLAPNSPGFAYAYFDPTHPTNRIGSMSYPNGQSTVYNYYGITGDERLQEIKNLTPASSVLSQNDYTYNSVGTIATWQQQTDSNTPLLWTEGYDYADQLKSAVQTNTAFPSSPIAQDTYSYDNGGNRISAYLSGVTRTESPNALNQLTSSNATGNQNLNFTGTVNGTDTVQVNGTAASVSGASFNASVSLAPGSTNTVTVVAQDASGNTRTNHYQTIVAAQPNYSPTYDADGNEQTNGAGEAYTWDAKNELASIVYTSGSNNGNHTEFAYDAIGRRITIVERTGTTVGSGTVTSTKQLVWDGTRLAEERNSSNTVTKRFFAQGEQINGSSYYYTRDHLGSVREMTDGTGRIQARYDYDPYGRSTYVQGALASDFQYAGYYEHPNSGLALTLYRAYDPIASRWLSRDPLPDVEMSQGPNLYEYVANEPFANYDPFGLDNINLTPPGTPEHQIVDNAGTNPNSFSVGAHGASNTVSGPDGRPISPQDLANMIKNNKDYNPKTPVYLNACSTGAPSAPGFGPDNYAQQLANALKNTVYAPTFSIGRTDITNPITGNHDVITYQTNGGSYQKFTPH